MIVDLTVIESWPWIFDLVVEPAETELDVEGFRLKSSVKAKGEIESHAGWFEVKGVIEAGAEIDCSRCLEPIDRSLSVPFNIRLLRSDDLAGVAENAIDKSELDSSVLDSDQVDLTDVVREQILLDLPEQVFCKEDCKGLCPKCGANLNLIECNCEEDEMDPRWAALKDLK